LDGFRAIQSFEQTGVFARSGVSKPSERSAAMTFVEPEENPEMREAARRGYLDPTADRSP